MRTGKHIYILNKRLRMFYEHLMSGPREFLLQWKAKAEGNHQSPSQNTSQAKAPLQRP